MAHIIVVYGTTEGQTAKIAQHIAAAGRGLGHHVDVALADDLEPNVDLSKYAAAVIGASLHDGHFQRSVATFIQTKRDWLAAHPTAFFSVSLSEASSDAQERAELWRAIDAFIASSNLRPRVVASFAGALKLTQYSWLKRALLKRVAPPAETPLDKTRDYEFTNWCDVDRFVHDFMSEVLG